MEILFLLIPLSIVLLIVAIGAFIWAARSGQYEDLEGPAHRLIMNDEDDPMIPPPPQSRAERKRQAEAAQSGSENTE